MVTLHVTSLSRGAGKTAFCAGFGKILNQQGKTVGYLQPVLGMAPDADAIFLKETLGLSETVAELSPAFKDENELKSGIKAAFDKVAAGKDIVLVESQLPAVKQALPGKTVIIGVYGEIDILPNYSAADGFVINKVPAGRMATINARKNELKERKVNVSGVLPEEKALLTFSLKELAELLEGQIAGSTQEDALAGSFMLGAMTADSALPYFNRKNEKVAILRAERADMQMVALNTDTRALVLYGNAAVIPMVQLRAKDKKVALITTKLNAAAITGRLDDKILQTRFQQPSKVARMAALLSANMDITAFLKILALS